MHIREECCTSEKVCCSLVWHGPLHPVSRVSNIATKVSRVKEWLLLYAAQDLHDGGLGQLSVCYCIPAWPLSQWWLLLSAPLTFHCYVSDTWYCGPCRLCSLCSSDSLVIIPVTHNTGCSRPCRLCISVVCMPDIVPSLVAAREYLHCSNHAATVTHTGTQHLHAFPRRVVTTVTTVTTAYQGDKHPLT